jgi:hypothetical protein
MATRRNKPVKTGAEERAELDAGINKVYLTWIIGIIIGALGLKPTSINAAGLALSIERPEIVQGLVFLVCLWETYILLAMIGLFEALTGRDAIRNTMWRLLPKGRKSFRGQTLGDLEKLRRNVKNNIRAKVWVYTAIAALPAIFIICFNHGALGAAIGAIVGLKP